MSDACSSTRHDLAIVGAGIVGLAHALAAARRGLSVILVDRDAQANGASVRNFGFVTVTGQERGAVWAHARRSRDIWAEIAGPAGIPIVQRGLALIAQRPEARAICDAFLRTEMAEGCRWLDAPAARALLGDARPAALEGILSSTIDLRVESRTALPALARWLTAAHRVEIRRGVLVQGVEPGRLCTSKGTIRAARILFCPGDEGAGLFPAAFAQAEVTRCKLQMLRLASPGFRLPAPLMADLSLVRYLGYAALPEAQALAERLAIERPDYLAHGVHLIVTQSADGTLIVGDSHHYADTPDPFAVQAVDDLILDEVAAVLGSVPPVLERWTGTYAAAARHHLVTMPMDDVWLAVVTSGTGASTAFGLAEDVIAAMYPDTLDAAA